MLANMDHKVIALTEIVLNEYGDFILKNNGKLVNVEPVGKPFILRCDGSEYPFDEIRKNLRGYIKDLNLSEDLNTIGIVIGEKTEFYEYGRQNLYPAQFYKILDD